MKKLLVLFLLVGCGSLSEAQRIKLERRVTTLGEGAAAWANAEDAASIRAETAALVSDLDVHLK